MKNIMREISKITKAAEIWGNSLRIPYLEPEERVPMLCRCGKRFFKLRTWVIHWKKDHRRLSKAYDKRTHQDRVNLLLGMMRKASPRKEAI